MSGFRQPEVARDQIVLWSRRLEDAVPADHPVRHVDYMFRSEVFRDTFREWESQYVLCEGKPPYPPRDLSGLYLYGMLNRIRSSRQLEMACHNRLDVIWLMSGQCPDHVAVDGTKIEADAGKGSVHGEESIRSYRAKVDEQVAKLEAEWEANEKREANLLGAEAPWTPKKDRPMDRRLSAMKRKQERLNQALESIERRRKENVEAGAKAPKAISSVTDPASRVMLDKEGKSKPNYNAQLVVDETCGMIVAAAVNDETNDNGQLVPMLKEVEQQCGRLPQEASADSGYNTGAELVAIEKLGVVSYLPDAGDNSGPVKTDEAAQKALEAARSGQALSEEQVAALPKDSEGRIDKTAFTYDAQRDVYRCPTGQTLGFVRTSQDRQKSGVVIRRQYGNCPACAACPPAQGCCKDATKGRMINRDQYEEHRERLRARMKTEEGKQRYKRRRETVEPRIGWAKRGLGVRRFMRRGLEAVRTEWMLVCTAMNVSILLRNWEAVMGVIGKG